MAKLLLIFTCDEMINDSSFSEKLTTFVHYGVICGTTGEYFSYGSENNFPKFQDS